MIARARGARVVAIDVDEQALALAQALGATASIAARSVADVGAAVRDLTTGGAHASIDAVGSAATARASLESLRPRGRHLQVGLLLARDAEPALPMGPLIAHELRIIGVHGMPAHRYGAMLKMIAAGELQPRRLVGRTIGLDQSIDALTGMGQGKPRGLTVITSF
jgi:alcohol dehydrogenase